MYIYIYTYIHMCVYVCIYIYIYILSGSWKRPGGFRMVSINYHRRCCGSTEIKRKPRTETIRKPGCSARCKMFGMLARGSLSVRIQCARERPFPRPRSFSGNRRLCWPTETIRKPRTETIRKRWMMPQLETIRKRPGSLQEPLSI